MCGYIKRVTDRPAFRELMEQLGWDELIEPLTSSNDSIQHFYPAFGGNPNRKIKGLIIDEKGKHRAVDATWWFDCQAEDDELVVGKRTTFNARNLDSPLWRGALRHHRAIVIADGLGESRKIDGKKHQYLMESKKPFLLGALYRRFSNGHYSCAIITRDAHPKFEPYHDKAFPLFLPNDRELVNTWLNGCITESEEIDNLLNHPKLFPDLLVQEVKTYKNALPIGDQILLQAD